MKKIICLFALLLLSISVIANDFSISKEDISKIAKLIYQNECAGKEKYLTSWNEGEDFASLGIGHFIWYSKDNDAIFDESFPKLIKFMRKNKVLYPKIIDDYNVDCPWNSREEFYNDFDDNSMKTIRNFLIDTINTQALFMYKRLEEALPKLLENTEKKEHVKKQFYRVANSPLGMYVLIDYVNFKGEGIKLTERYNGYGWGLLQILENMTGDTIDKNTTKEFAANAVLVLSRRVDNSPIERNEKRWLPGWKKRIETYTKFD